jgi:hypothetical protein
MVLKVDEKFSDSCTNQIVKSRFYAAAPYAWLWDSKAQAFGGFATKFCPNEPPVT